MSERQPLIKTDSPLAEHGFFDGILRPVLAELIGVMLFVCVGTMAVYGGVSAGVVTASPPLQIALAHGLAIAFLVMATGSISGGHLNPAVTCGVFLSGGIHPVKAVLYVIGQLIGGILGSAITRGVLGTSKYVAIAGGAHALGDGVTPGQGILMELLLTSILVTVVLLTAVDTETKSVMAPIGIGLTVVVDILAGFFVTGGGMNPARSLGPAVVLSHDTGTGWEDHYVYWVGPLLGALLAVLWYRFFLAGQQNRLIAHEART